MFKHTLIKTAVMTAALAISPMAFAADDQAKSAADQKATPTGRDTSSSLNRSDSATVAGSQTDRSSSSRIGKGAFNEQKFVMKAMQGNQFEIQLGQLAQQKAESQEVKQLAQMLVQDHQQANQMLTQAMSGQAGGQAAPGAQAGAQAASPTGAQPSASSGDQKLDAVHQAMLAEMQQLQGAEFDQAFVVGQLGDHVKSVLKYRTASQEAQSPQIKQYATQSLPKLQSHLRQLQQLAGWDDATTASGTISGSGDHSGHATPSDRQSTGGALGGTNGNATDRNAASGGAQPNGQSR